MIYSEHNTLYMLQQYYTAAFVSMMTTGEGEGGGLRNSVSVTVSLQHHLEITSHWR